MAMELNKQFGAVISRIINGENLSENESFWTFSQVLNNEVHEIQQGAFLASLTTKGETAEEIAGGWRAIYEHDTNKIEIQGVDKLIDNCGTGMDGFKTFNISTAASIVGSSAGLKIARHGARAISSQCGTVDISENLGVDVNCTVEIVAKSIEDVGLGLFNGMSPEVHPHALGRILSKIHFGSPLNIAASLANPALPQNGLRGVYSREIMKPVLEVMQHIGYKNAIVVHGAVDKFNLGIDEASVCGKTHCLQLSEGSIKEFSFTPEDVGLRSHDPLQIAAQPDITASTNHLLNVLSGKLNGPAEDVICLNSALLLLLANEVDSIEKGIDRARSIITNGEALETLHKWVSSQNKDPQNGREILNRHLEKI